MNGKRSGLLSPMHVLLAALVVLVLPGPVLGDTDDNSYEGGWSLRFYAAAMDFDQGSPPPQNAGYDISTGGGVALNGEYRFSRHLGVDLGAMAGGGVDLVAQTYQGGHPTGLTYDTVGFTPLTAGLGIHLTPDSRVDVSVCPLLAWVRYGNLSVATGPPGFARTSVHFDDDLALGAALGLGVPFGERRWSFEANVTYIDSAMSGRGQHGIRVDEDFDVTSFGVGFGYRF